MIKRTFVAAAMLLSLCAAASCKPEYYTPKFNGGENGGSSTVTPGKGTGLHTIGEILPYTTVNSHAGEEKWSVLQPMWNDFSVVPHSYLIDQSLPEAQRTVYYTRIKKMANGRYLMLYMGGELGSRCYATTSDDLLKWSTPELLLEPVQETVAGASDWIRYSGPDAVVLPNGDVLAVFSFRANNHYSQGIGCGLVTMRSRNNGLTWSAPQKIHDGPTWEPYLLVLPDGRIQCYFTDPIPMTKNSGTSVLVSSDNGQTWTPKIRCSRMYKYDYDGPNTAYTGQKIYTDQMPSFRVLNDGKTLLGFLECRLENPASISGSSYYKVSVVYNDGLDWKDLGEESAGPPRRHTAAVGGAAGYVSNFPSGEVVLSCNISSIFSLKLLDHDGANLTSSWDSGWLKAFDGKGCWGSTEAEDGNKLIATMRSANDGAQIGRFWLNHSQFVRSSQIAVDGKSDEWPLDQALFVGGKKGSEAMIRVARDAENLYVAADYFDATALKIYVSNKEPKLTVKATLDGKGKLSLDGTGVTGKCGSAKAASGATGYVAEVKIPLSTLGAAAGDAVYLYAAISDASGEVPFTGALASTPSSWQRIVIK